MASKNKLKRFEENKTFLNLIQPSREKIINKQFEFKGNWSLNYFKNNNPIVLELGCGKGEYSLYLAELNPEINYIGIDIKGARIWRGAKTAIEKGIKNVAFVRTQIELVTYLFSSKEIDLLTPLRNGKEIHHLIQKLLLSKKLIRSGMEASEVFENFKLAFN